MAERFSFAGGQLLTWQYDRWIHFAPVGFQLLIMEEVHVQHHHIGGQKMYELLKHKCYWPTMKQDCAKYSNTCFEC
jgi:Integrase zinc binding domain